MGKMRIGILGSCVLVILSILTVAGLAAAQAPRGLGANTGDASTPFTGLASAPEASLFVGAATTSIPIEVPPGRKNLTPKLALTYNSGGGPSAYGYGWDLPLGKVQRSTKHGLLSCTDTEYRDDFVLALPGANVECTLNESDWRCYPAIEESFLRIQYTNTNNQWDVWDKSGLHYVFGLTSDARSGSDTSSLFTAGSSGADCTYTYSWGLSKIEDPNGNILEISYIKFGYMSYPHQIDYGGNSAAGKAHLFQVNFVWSSPRPAGDAITNSMGGFPATLTKLLSRIEVNYLVDGSRVCSYLLQYEFQTDAPDRIGRQSFLSAVTLFAKNDQALARADGLAAQTKFLYQQNDQSSGRFGFGSVQYSFSGDMPGLLQA